MGTLAEATPRITPTATLTLQLDKDLCRLL